MIKTAFTLLPMFVSLFWLMMFLSEPGRNKFVRTVLMAFFSITFLLYLAHALYFNFEYKYYLYLDPVYSFATVAVYPLYYLYILYLTREVRFRPKYFLLLTPALLIGISTAVLYYIMGNEESDFFVRQVLYHEGGDYHLSSVGRLQLFRYRIIPVVFIIQLVLIILSGVRLIVQFDEKVRNYYSDTEGKELKWTRRLFITFAVFSVFSIIANVIGRTFFLNEELFVIPSLIFSLLLFKVGYVSFNQRFTAMDLKKDDNAPTFEDEMFAENEHEFMFSSLQQSDMKKRLHYLLKDEKIYTRKDLRIVDISGQLNTNRTYVSRLINSEYGKSFSELINHYRFEEAKKMLIAPEYSLLSIAEIANQSGFSSESSFYRIFKKETGIAPGDWRKLNGKN